MSTVINEGTNVPQWSIPPAFREAVSGIAHKNTRLAMRGALAITASRSTAGLVPETALLPLPKTLDDLQSAYEASTLVLHSEDPEMPWSEAITRVLTNLQHVDPTQWRLTDD